MPSRRFEPCVRAAFAVVLLSGLAPAALAELPQTYLALLQEADSRDLSDDRFLETADMVSVLVDGGRAEVHAAILAHLGPVALAVTTSLNVNFLRKPEMQPMFCDCRILKLGKRLAVIDAILRQDGLQDAVAQATVTYSIPPVGR